MQEDMMEQEAGSPADKEVVELMIAHATEFIHNTKNKKSLLDAMQGSNPGQAIALVASDILEQIAASASRKGKRITPEIVLAAMTVVIGLLIELGEAAGVLMFASEEERTAMQQEAIQVFMQSITGGQQPASAPEEEMPEQSAPTTGALGRAMGG